MAIATGTALLIGAGVAAAGGVAKAKIDSNAAKRAGAIQQQTGTEALTYQKGRDTIADQRYMDAWNDYQRRHAAWEKRNFGGDSGAAAGGGGGNFYTPLTPQPALAPGQLTPLGDAGGATPKEGATVADLGPWSDWKRYGVS